ncbi:MAG: hypothetical protein MRY32_01875 [Rickettsiales bacterium]|nr:hypothetical protein [Rickettsiales bacterium]
MVSHPKDEARYVKSGISRAMYAAFGEFRNNLPKIAIATVTGMLVGLTLSFALPPVWAALGAASAPTFGPAVGALFFGGISMFTSAYSPVINAAHEGYTQAKSSQHDLEMHAQDLSTLGFVDEPSLPAHVQTRIGRANTISTTMLRHEGVVSEESISKEIH